jgi:hypothetical protein
MRKQLDRLTGREKEITANCTILIQFIEENLYLPSGPADTSYDPQFLGFSIP